MISISKFRKQAEDAFLSKASNTETTVTEPVPLGDTPKIRKIRQRKMADWYLADSMGLVISIPEFPEFSQGPRSQVSPL